MILRVMLIYVFFALHGCVQGHSIHCSDEELALLKRTDTAVVNCASSNFLLGSGIMDIRRFLEVISCELYL